MMRFPCLTLIKRLGRLQQAYACCLRLGRKYWFRRLRLALLIRRIEIRIAGKEVVS